MLDVPELRQFAKEALEIADDIGRDDLWADAMSCLASADNADGHVLKAVEADRRALQRSGGVHTMTLGRSAISLYHAGLTEEAILRSTQSLESARRSGDPAFIVFSLSHLGVANASAGHFGAAQRAFDEARNAGRRYGVLPLLARAISMSTGMHAALGNLAAAETLSHEARDLARQVAFAPPLISFGSIFFSFMHEAANLAEPKRF